MYLLPFTVILLFASYGFAIPVQTTTTTTTDAAPQWTIYEASRQRTDNSTTCNWHMKIADSSTSAPNNGTDSNNNNNNNANPTNTTATYACDFQVVTPAGQDCGTRSFDGARCRSSNSSSTDPAAFRVNGGHSDLGFVVMVLVNAAERAQAYVGFDDAALDAGAAIAPQTVSAMSLDAGEGEGAERRHLPRGQDGGGGGGEAGTETAPDGARWMIEDMIRHVDNGMNAVHLNFIIRFGNESSDFVTCDLRLDAPVGANLATWQWYDKKCSDSDYYASWGYLPASDAGIMTLVSPARDSEAFFGFANISMSEILGSAGPSPVSLCNCGVVAVN
ncbi:hypothetical protein F5Y19DRAFT_490463 [Xylariaceae sp. FL1651]|nr:hypothetical protein F5Y19DRAFT_490463 [Xylariaceae sp. FL1651]